MSEPKSKNITWHHGLVEREEREKRNKNKGVILWYTGLSGSGLSTVNLSPGFRSLAIIFLRRDSSGPECGVPGRLWARGIQ